MKRNVEDEMTLHYYPEKLTVEEFADEIKENIDEFKKNMLNLKLESNYAEEWMKMFSAWMEMR